MKIKTFVTFVLMAALVISGLCSCASNKGSVDTHSSKISVDWAGVYSGTIPAADVSGIDVRMKLNKDNTYELTYEYLDIPDNRFSWTGAFQWDDTGNIITIEIADAPSHYKVAENKLIQLDLAGNLITGDLADNYVLKKEP